MQVNTQARNTPSSNERAVRIMGSEVTTSTTGWEKPHSRRCRLSQDLMSPTVEITGLDYQSHMV